MKITNLIWTLSEHSPNHIQTANYILTLSKSYPKIRSLSEPYQNGEPYQNIFRTLSEFWTLSEPCPNTLKTLSRPYPDGEIYRNHIRSLSKHFPNLIRRPEPYPHLIRILYQDIPTELQHPETPGGLQFLPRWSYFLVLYLNTHVSTFRIATLVTSTQLYGERVYFREKTFFSRLSCSTSAKIQYNEFGSLAALGELSLKAVEKWRTILFNIQRYRNVIQPPTCKVL